MQQAEMSCVLSLQGALEPLDEHLQCVSDFSNPHTLLVLLCPAVFWLHMRRRCATRLQGRIHAEI